MSLIAFCDSFSILRYFISYSSSGIVSISDLCILNVSKLCKLHIGLILLIALDDISSVFKFLNSLIKSILSNPVEPNINVVKLINSNISVGISQKNPFDASNYPSFNSCICLSFNSTIFRNLSISIELLFDFIDISLVVVDDVIVNFSNTINFASLMSSLHVN